MLKTQQNDTNNCGELFGIRSYHIKSNYSETHKTMVIIRNLINHLSNNKILTMAANLNYRGFGYFRDYMYLLTVPLNLYLHVFKIDSHFVHRLGFVLQRPTCKFGPFR